MRAHSAAREQEALANKMRDLEQQRTSSGDLDDEFNCYAFLTAAVAAGLAATILTFGTPAFVSAAVIAAIAAGAESGTADRD